MIAYKRIIKYLENQITLLRSGKLNRNDVIDKHLEMLFWMRNERSIYEHRCREAFVSYLFESIGIEHGYEKNQRELWIDSILKPAIGFVQTINTITKIENGITTIYKLEKIRSFAFNELGQQEHNKVFKNIQEWSLNHYGIDFEKWYKSYWKTDAMCQYPYCNQLATQEHHIFPGTANREISDSLGYVVKACQLHHDWSHGKQLDKFPESKHIDIQEFMARKWCKVIGIKYNVALKNINKI